MVLEIDPIVFLDWLLGALRMFALLCLGGSVAALFLGFLWSAVRHGPLTGGDITFHAVINGIEDLLQARPRRVLALARLAIQESLRRRVWVALVVFVIILGFAGWFLDPTSFDPARLYLDFVLSATSYLMLLIALFLSVFSLPADFKNRTIYTIVTKPVRRSEIILGRLLGFSAVGTGLLVIMGICSYLFVVRSLNHTHVVEVESLEPTTSSTSGAGFKGRTTTVNGHHHQFSVDADGNGSTDLEHGHFHEVHREGDRYMLGPPDGMFVARVPKYGSLRFKDRWGKPGKGISVGNEWTYRKFIEGGSLAAATWTFEHVTPDLYPDGLPLEMTVRVFRSHKGVMDRGIAGSLSLRNPKTGRASSPLTFRAKDFHIDRRLVPLKLQDAAGHPLDLFQDLVSPEGSVEVVMQCMEPAQYFGAAKADVYLKPRDASFGLNFIKGYFGIWSQVLLVTAFGILFSTFVSGPVAMLATLCTVVMGFCTSFILDLARGVQQGGGPLESTIRIATQANMTLPMDEGPTRVVVQFIDAILLTLLEGACYLLPDFRDFNNVDYVSNGFDIPLDKILQQSCLVLAFWMAVVVAGTFILKTREVAQ